MHRTRAKSRAKQDGVSEELRRQIVTGELSLGSRLPLRVELAQKFQVSPLTMQMAMNRLKAEGFIRSKLGQGTFVVDYPPHLYDYALVLPTHRTQISERWSNFWTALTNEAELIKRSTRNNISAYYGVNGHNDVEDYVKLIDAIKAQRLAGIVLLSLPYDLQGTPLMDDPGIPRVLISDFRDDSLPPQVHPDATQFVDKALRYLYERGRRRVAIIGPRPYPGSDEYWWSAVAAAGMTCRPYWWQIVPLHCDDAARNAVHLLFNASQTERPDALIIADDHLTTSATSGLLLAGVRPPIDLDVVAHTNYPYPIPAMTPVKRLGAHARQVLETCFEVLKQQRNHVKVPAHTYVPMVFEETLEEQQLVDNRQL